MQLSLNATQFAQANAAVRQSIEGKLAPVARLLGDDASRAFLELELANAPAQGRSATPVRLTARLTLGGAVFHAEAVKPTPESAADRVRRTLEAEIRHLRGKDRGIFRRGALRLKGMLRFGR